MDPVMMPPEKQRYSSKQFEALGRLSPAVAHDINNLLSGILGYSELLGESVAGPLRPHVEEIGKAARRIASLAQILMAFEPKHHGPPEVLDFSRIVREMERFIPHLLGPGIECTIEIEPGLWSVRGEWALTVNVIILLAVEIRDSMPEGGKLRLGI
jgi:two-component system cell cycle sensor histidine kinase/response regulator CckA